MEDAVTRIVVLVGICVLVVYTMAWYWADPDDD
jgi:hypothetical protein